eukprot:2073080-Alexandrium_andersonii.AAC.1
MAIRLVKLPSSSGMRCGTSEWTRSFKRSCSACTRTTTAAIGTTPRAIWSPFGMCLSSRANMS